MKKYSDKKEITYGKSIKLDNILKDCLLKSLVYEKALKEDSAQKRAV